MLNRWRQSDEPGTTQGRRVGFHLAVKLALGLVLATVAFLSVLGYVNLRLQRRHAEEIVLQSAERVSDVIRRSTHYQMLRNDRDALYETIRTLGSEPGIRRIRIFNEYGQISFSTDPAEVGTVVDKQAESCYACHAQEEKMGRPLERLPRLDRSRIFTDADGRRVLGVIRPIENEASCSNGACHAHPPDRRILGVIDADLDLDAVDAQLAAQQWQLGAATVLAVVLLSGVCIVLIWQVVHKPVRELTTGIHKVARGDLDSRLEVRSRDELGDLAESFNQMTADLSRARTELTGWAHTLEDRVEQKTRELKRAHEHVLQSEKMASIGKLAAVVAHEINNPLAGILTYSKLLRKWLAREEVAAQLDPSRRKEILDSLELIQSESRRCGEIVRNLLSFARAAPMHLEWANLCAVVDRVVRLVQHQADLAGTQIRVEIPADLPAVHCDPNAVQQVLLALVMNALDALPHGGNIWLRGRGAPSPGGGPGEMVLEVADDGAGIPADVLPHMFEPFFTTKERGHGVGLGLAVSRSIVERHGGRIEVQSEPGRGTTFTVTLPLDSQPPENEILQARQEVATTPGR